MDEIIKISPRCSLVNGVFVVQCPSKPLIHSPVIEEIQYLNKPLSVCPGIIIEK